ncbi:MAG: hypothetical protein CK424_05505 [Legionella sp.]|nr:MAG: hypothetical protein CK424_05505 [Legionella sp.]
MQQRFKLFLYGMVIFFCTNVQAHTSIIFSMGPSMQDDQAYQNIRLMRYLRTQRLQNRFIRARLAEMQLQQQMYDLDQAYDQYEYMDRLSARRGVMYPRQYLNNHPYQRIHCRRHVCVRTINP